MIHASERIKLGNMNLHEHSYKQEHELCISIHRVCSEHVNTEIQKVVKLLLGLR